VKPRNKCRWHKVCAVVLSLAMGVTMLPANAMASTSTDAGNGTFSNPVIYSDVPDIDVIRVENTYYMVSTTMHLSPGCPIMKSTDLVNWEIVNYVYDRLDDSDETTLRNDMEMYGNGQWASSLQYHDGTYYVAFNSNTTGTAYIFSTDDIENGSWKRTDLNGFFHDMALFFDDDGSAYIVYGNSEIKYVELEKDLSGVKKDGKSGTLFSSKTGADAGKFDGILSFEGTHIMKKDGYYYVFNICWPSGKPRIEVCHRSKTFPSTEWETKVILESNFANNGVNAGVAQGGVIDTADGDWYGFMFQDHGAIGRTPVLTDCTWVDGWPMLGKDGDGKTVEAVMELPVDGSELKSIVKSDEFYNDAEYRVYEASGTVNNGVAALKTENASETDNNGVDASDVETETQIVDVIVNGDFENGADGWQGFDGASIEACEDEAVSGNGIIKATGRTTLTSGMAQDLSGKLKNGKTYKITANLKYTDGPDTRNFNAVIQNGATWRERTVLGSVTAKKGEWATFTIEYTMPADAVTTENYLFFETSWVANIVAENDLMDFYVDNVTMTYETDGSEDVEEDKKEDDVVTDDSLINLIDNGGFESGDTTGWQITRTESAEIEAVSDNSASGSYSGHIYNRTSCGAGACQNISGELVRGKTYTISGKLKYDDGPATKKFYVTIENGDNYNWRENLISITAKKGEWTSFTGTYTVHDKSEQYPFDETQNYIFVETPWSANPSPEQDFMEFWVDDFAMTTENDNKIANGSFENGMTGWSGFENATIELSKEEAQDGESSVVTTNRTATGQGPSQDLSNKLTAGNKYTLTAYVKYNDGPDTKQFNATIQNGPDWSYRTVLGSVTAKKGEWTKLTLEYKMPEDAITTQNYLFFETPWSANPTKENDYMDFYVDNVSLIEQPVTEKEVAQAGENDYNGSALDKVWQWNHNPNNNNWSLTERSGWLRLTTGNKADGILDARNTLTQRTYGPTCSGKIKMDISNMKVGDVAGLSAFSYNYGYIAVKKESDGAKLVMVDASQNSVNGEDTPVEVEKIACKEDMVYLKADFDFAGGDKVKFYYSFDGNSWTMLGKEMKLTYELVHFMGSRFALFNYATKATGGYVDFDYFRVSDDLLGETTVSTVQKASLSNVKSLSGVINSECEVKLTMDALESNGHTDMKASISVPEIMDVTDVVFNTDAINGSVSYTYKNNRLLFSVTGEDVSFNAEDGLFATIKLRLNGYTDKDKTVSLNTDYITVDEGRTEYNVTGCRANIGLKYLDTGALAKKLGYSNPIVTQEFGADPYTIEYNGRVYVYMTADDYQYDANGNVIDNNFGYIKTLRVVSSDDMVNWTDHGEIKVAGEDGAAKWAAHSWAPAIAYKQIDGKDKFFLYFANDASGIGVLEADTPLGPWTDPIGKALITGQTPGCAGVVWCFDPAVLVDDDGSAYIYFGGGVPAGEQLHPKTARVAKLGEDMISIDGEAQLIDAPCMFEDSGIFKFGDTYYYSYCSNFTSPHGDGYPGYGTICYMTSKNPMGPFTYQGEIFLNPSIWFNVGGNNHHATFVFENQSYFIYHAQTVSKALGVEKGYRSTHIDRIELNSDGSIKPIAGTYEGISQLRCVNPYERIDAETIAWNAGVKTEVCKETGKLFADYNMNLTNLQDGDWTSVAQLDFGKNGAASFSVNAASKQGGTIEVRLDSPEGSLIGTVNVEATKNEDTYETFTCDVSNVSGIRNVFLVFRGETDNNLMNVDFYQFTEKESTPETPSTPQTPNTPQTPSTPQTPNTPQNPQDSGNKKPADQSEILKQYMNKSFFSKNLNYKVTQCTVAEKTVMVTGAKKKFTSVTIPATVQYKGMTFKVTEIGKNAFKNQKKLKKVVIGKNVEKIGSKSFYGAKKLSKITFKGTKIKSIGKYAFKGIKKNAVFDIKNSKIKQLKKLLKKAKTKSYKVK